MSPMLATILTLYVACQAVLCSANDNKTNKQLITEALMANYDRINLPVLNLSKSVGVRINPRLFSIITVDVAQQTIFFKQWLNMYWYDANLKWNPDLYGGIESIMLQRSTIWLPDIVIVEQTSISTLSDDLSLAQVTNAGYVTISSDELVTVSCHFDVTDFPFDTQICSFRLTSWMYSANEIDPFPTEPIDLTAYNENEWTLHNMTARKLTSVADGATYVDVWYDIKITRKPGYYITTFIWPSFLITCLSIIGVFSPFNDSGEREEKLTMGLTTLLTMAVILMIVTDSMPKSSSLTLLGVFIMLQIGIASVATMFATCVIYLHRSWMNDTPVPNWLLRITRMNERTRKNSTATQTLQSKADNSRESKTDQKFSFTVQKGAEALNLNISISDIRDESESLRDQWSKMTHRLDRIFMIIFLVVNLIICITILSIGNSKLAN